MGFFSELKDWYIEQKMFRDAEEPDKNMLRYIARNFNEEVIKPTKEDFRELKQSIKNDNQQLKNDFKYMVKEVNPPIGDLAEKNL